MRPVSEVRDLLVRLEASPEEQKSVELISNLLAHTDAPYSRDQFHPGHITCTALVLHPQRDRFLLMFHHRHLRWLLPGGHVEKSDKTLAETARREAVEETMIEIKAAEHALVGVDVHAIPARKKEPYHLHHDLIFAMSAVSEKFECTDEAPKIAWCRLNEYERYDVPPNIRWAAERAMILKSP